MAKSAELFCIGFAVFTPALLFWTYGLLYPRYMLRPYDPADTNAVMALYGVTFPDENLCPLVCDLASLPQVAMSLVSEIEGRIVGHGIVTLCTAQVSVGLLGPLAVLPDFQKQGHGTALIDALCNVAAQQGAHSVCLLGDPSYYGRFGFQQEHAVHTPYPLPEAWAAAWQSKTVSTEAVTGPNPSGTLVVPTPWQDITLWS